MSITNVASNAEKQKVYFPNLNGIRFIAALLVIIHHIEQIKAFLGIEGYWKSVPFIHIIGKLGVILFFVLSGFLITYLLLAEEKTTGKISIKDFYIRRVLRIWPLYFFTIAIAFLLLPNIELFTFPGYEKDVVYNKLTFKLILYALILPNLALSMFGVVPYASHTWSIGTEEQYYLIWPVLIKYIKKYRIGLMVFIILFYLALKYFFKTSYVNSIPYYWIFTGFWKTFNIDCMAIGGIYAIILFNKNKLAGILSNKYLFYITLVTAIGCMVYGVYIPELHYEFYSVLFGIIIFNFASNKDIAISLENGIFTYLGNISYSLYMFHTVGIILGLKIALALNITTNWVIYPLSIGTVIIIAGLSYKFLETPFLKLKPKFTKVLSGNEVKA